MGAWIEIQVSILNLINEGSHPTMGAWIEIRYDDERKMWVSGRTPRWVRGLKSTFPLPDLIMTLSHPTMGAWIEIMKLLEVFKD